MSFVHLHNHSEYSLLDGASKIDKMIEKACKSGMSAVALTDHGNMFGALEFYKAAKARGIKPILGFEGYISPTDRFDRQTKGNYHITLLAKNNKGYENLMYLCSMGFLEGFYYKPRIDKELLREYSEGIIAGSACLHGEINRKLLASDYNGAKKAVEEYKEIFGKDNFFLEIMRHGLEDQQKIDKDIIKLSIETNTPLIATNDCHYLNKLDAEAQDALLCVQTNKHIDDKDRMRMGSQEFYFKTEEEMLEVFKDNPEFVYNSTNIADMCNVELEIGKLSPPHYTTPDGSDEKEYLRNLAYQGLEAKTQGFDSEKKELYRKRLEYELQIIEQMGFSGYFLIVWDFINFAKKNKIPVGPGRGSAAGSVVSYCIGITDIDPIKYNLLFERFLNPERVTMPDIDVDFCAVRRDEVIHYVREKYGKYNVAQVITFGTMKAKAVVRDVARVLGFPYKDADRIAKMISEDNLEEAIKSNLQLQQEIKKDEKVKKLFEISKVLEGVKRHASIHAAGVVISTEPIYKRCPLYKAPGEKTIATQFSKDLLEDVGLIKFDFLGLKNLTVIDETVKQIGDGFDISRIPLDDEKTFELLQSGNTLGVFQLESQGMQRLITDLKPSVFEDLIALVALYRPGPLGSGMVQDFIDRKHGKKPIEYPLPELGEILRPTYGIILYQEQVMQIASRLAGYSLGEADILRRAMGKKKKEVMDQQRGIFVERAVKNGIPKEKAEYIFDLMAKFAEYGFNKSHSAAYAYISYQTAYLKAHYPEYFMSALLTSEKNNTDQIAKYIEECNRLNITVLPPDINDSFHDFAVATKDGKKVIRFGFSAIKNVGDAAIENIINERKSEKFKNIFDFAKRVDTRKVNRKVLESLIKSGCFDSLHANRASLLASVDVILDWAAKGQKSSSKKMMTLFSDTKSEEEAHPKLVEAQQITQEQILEYERELLGFFVSSNPISKYETIVGAIVNATSQTAKDMFGRELIMAGIPVSIRKTKTKKKETMAFVKFMDTQGTFETTIFPNLYKQKSELFNKNQLLVVVGNLDPTSEKLNVIVKDVIEYEKLSDYINGVELFLMENDLEAIEKIKTVMERNKGDKPLFILYKEHNKLYTIQTLLKVAINGVMLESLKRHNIKFRFILRENM